MMLLFQNTISSKYGMHHRLLRRMFFLFKGQSLARILMNEALACETLQGRVVDVGGGRRPDYFDFLQRAHDVQVEAVDASFSGIDFEKDPLPFVDAYADTVLLCNVLEHIYEFKFLTQQVRRVLKKKGKLIGFVPFWVGYHPDPHDYFRYTPESIVKILEQAGFVDVHIRAIGGGPILANFNTIVLSMPRVCRPMLYLLYMFVDRFFVFFRPASVQRNPLGFVFTASTE